jgi:hypothetical protein
VNYSCSDMVQAQMQEAPANDVNYATDQSAASQLLSSASTQRLCWSVDSRLRLLVLRLVWLLLLLLLVLVRWNMSLREWMCARMVRLLLVRMFSSVACACDRRSDGRYRCAHCWLSILDGSCSRWCDSGQLHARRYFGSLAVVRIIREPDRHGVPRTGDHLRHTVNVINTGAEEHHATTLRRDIDFAWVRIRIHRVKDEFAPSHAIHIEEGRVAAPCATAISAHLAFARLPIDPTIVCMESMRVLIRSWLALGEMCVLEMQLRLIEVLSHEFDHALAESQYQRLLRLEIGNGDVVTDVSLLIEPLRDRTEMESFESTLRARLLRTRVTTFEEGADHVTLGLRHVEESIDRAAHTHAGDVRSRWQLTCHAKKVGVGSVTELGIVRWEPF